MFCQKLTFSWHFFFDKLHLKYKYLQKSKMATISHFVFKVSVVLMSQINSEAMFCLKVIFYLHFYEK